MTLPARKSRRVISGSGWSNPLTHAFLLENVSYLSVWADDVELTPGVDYSVSGVGDPAGYEVTITEPGDWSPEVWVLTVEYPIDQPSDVDQGGQFGQRFEEALDRLALGLQTLDDRTARALKVSNTTDPDISVEVDAAEPDSILGWNGDGTRVENKGSIPQIQAVAGIADDIAALGPIAAQIVTVAGVDNDVVIVAGIYSDVHTVAGISGAVTSVVSMAPDISSVASIAADVTTVAGVAGSVSTVASVAPAVTDVAAIDASVVNVAAVADDIAALGPITAQIVKVAGVDDDVTVVAGNIANVTTVASNIADVNAVAAIDGDVTTVAASDAAVNTVASNIADVQSAAANMSDIQAAPQAASDAEAARDFAYAWSSAAEDAPVDDGIRTGFSAYHWAVKAAALVTGGIAAAIHVADAKSSPADADELALVDSADGWSLKKLTWASLKAALSSVFLPKSGGEMAGGLSFGSDVASSATDLTRHIALYGTAYGFSVTAGYVNYVGTGHRFYGGGSVRATLDASGNWTVSGKATVGAAPTADMDVTTKKYVDDAISATPMIGVGQTWQDVSGSRAVDTSYQNTTGKPIQVAINAANGSGGGIQVSANGTTWVDAPASSTVATAQRVSGNVVVPNGHYYRLQGLTTIHSWSELR